MIRRSEFKLAFVQRNETYVGPVPSPSPTVLVHSSHFIPSDRLPLLMLEVEQPVGADVDPHVTILVVYEKAEEERNQGETRGPGEGRGESKLVRKDPHAEQEQKESYKNEKDQENVQGPVEGVDLFDLSRLEISDKRGIGCPSFGSDCASTFSPVPAILHVYLSYTWRIAGGAFLKRFVERLRTCSLFGAGEERQTRSSSCSINSVI